MSMRHVLFATFLVGQSALAQVTVTAQDGDRHIVASTYQATLASDGNLTSLRLGGVEWVDARPGNPRGAYTFQDGAKTMPEISALGDAAFRCVGPVGQVEYSFLAEGIEVKVANRSDKPLTYLMVMLPGIEVVRLDGRSYRKALVESGVEQAALFRDGWKLDVAGCRRVWGWEGRHQVWEVRVPANGSAALTMTCQPASEAELAGVKAALEYVARPPEEPTRPMWDLDRLGLAPNTWPGPDGLTEPGVSALFYEGEPFEGRPTRVFAWLGLPEVPAGETVPGMVLVHGGGGTAFADWVRLWNSRGYAAIAMDTCGCLPLGEHSNRPRHEWAGPAGWGGLNQIDWPREDQWTYHAVAAILRAHSLLRAQPGVDPERIGLTGISWGGYLTSLTAGVDHRFKFVAPVYGCGFYRDTHFGPRVEALGVEKGNRWMRWWDPSSYLSDATMPMLWVTGTNDFAYWFPGLQKSYRLARGPRTLAVRLRMGHGQGQGAAPEEIAVFADQLFRGGPPLATILDHGRAGRSVWAEFDAGAPVVAAELLYTLDATPTWPERQWQAVPAVLGAGRVTAELPDGTTCYFLNLIDARGLVVSTEHESLVP